MVLQKQQNRWKKGEQTPFLPNIGDGVLEATNKQKEQAPLLPRVGDGITKATKKNEKNRNLARPLSRPSDGTQELTKRRKKTGASSPFAKIW
jgi:hypothetical protein